VSDVVATPDLAVAERRQRARWRWLAAAELVAASAAILLDLAIPSLVLLVLAGVSLAIRREGLSTLGLRRPSRPHVVGVTAGFAVVWSLFQLGVTMPVANHVSGQRQDMGIFADVEGDVGLLLLLVVLSWTLGAFVEELAFRGFLFTRLREVLGAGRLSVVIAVLVSSALFGFNTTLGLVTFVLIGPVYGFW
jgi:membrane protease YdiL (CAAX protease family)